MDHEVPAPGADGRDRDTGAGSDPGHLRTTRGVDHERARVEGPRASADLVAAAGDNQPPDAVAQRAHSAPSIGLAEFLHLKKQFWGRHLWGRGYFCCSAGNVTDEVIAKYIAEQNIDQDEDFKVDG
jgi:hypothetical protein